MSEEARRMEWAQVFDAYLDQIIVAAATEQPREAISALLSEFQQRCEVKGGNTVARASISRLETLICKE